MSMTRRLRGNVFTLLLVAGSAVGGYSLTQAECSCDYCCWMDYCHAKISGGQGKFCRRYTVILGECQYNYTGGFCYSPCTLVEFGTTDVYDAGDDCQAFCYDFFGAECGDGKWNEADSCASPGNLIAEDVTNFGCEEYVGST